MLSSEPALPKNARLQIALYDLLKRNGDVHFQEIYKALGGDPDRVDERDARGRWYAQSWISLSIRRLNRRLRPTGQQIAPGRLRQTYCLTSTHR